MNHSHPAGLLSAYNSLTDKHLAGYFNNTRIQRHLLRSGLITRSGRILSEKEYKLNIMKRDHQKYIRECLAQAIFHKVLDMERYHQLEIKKKLETLARKERIQRFKGEHTRQSIENNMPILSPRPPMGPKTNRGHSVLVDEGHSGPLTLTAPRPYTAPGNMQPPIRLQPLPSYPSVRTIPKITSGSRSKPTLLENEAPFPIGGKKAMMKYRNSVNNSQRMNPYQLPNINGYMMPIPPLPPPPVGKVTRENRSETWRRRRFRPTTAPNGLEPLFPRNSGRMHKTSLHSNAAITMIYLGKNVHLSYDDQDFRDEITVYQQHCGGENLCVYKGKLLEKETFQFISKRHHGFPFSLTFFLNGMQVNRLSSCCEYKHRKGSRLGGKRGYFGFVCVERASPCYKCIIAMGLDKKTSSTKPRKEKSTEKREELRKIEGKLRKDRENVISRRNEIEGNKTSVSATCLAQEINIGVREVRTAMEEMELKGKRGQDDWEDNQENDFKYEYEEDFEVDEEKQDGKANEEGQAGDEMDGTSKSPWEDETDHLVPEKEGEFSSPSWKAPDADDNVREEDDGYSESDLEEDKPASSTSSGSHPYSSDSENDSAERDREVHAENCTDESTRGSSTHELSENVEPEKFHHPIEESLEIETEDQDITKAAVLTEPLPKEESCENVLEEMQNGTQRNAENLLQKSRKHASKEEKEKDKSKLWEGSTKVKDKRAGLPGVEEGVGQIKSEAMTLGCHCQYDAESGVSSTDEAGKPMNKPEIDTGGAPNRNLVVEKRAALGLNKEAEQVAQTQKAAAEGGSAPQHQDVNSTEEEGDAVPGGEVGVKEAPLGEKQPRAEQPAPAEQLTENSEVPLCIAGRAEAEAEGDRMQDKERFNPTGTAAGRDSVGLSQEAAPQEPALVQMVLGTKKAASEGEQGLEEAALTNTPALSSQHLQEAAALRKIATPPKMEVAERGEAVSEVGSKMPDVDAHEEEAFMELENMGPMEGTASEREDDSEERTVVGEEPDKERKEILETETPLGNSTGEVKASQRGPSEDSPKELLEKGAARAEAGSQAEAHKEEPGPQELDVVGEGRKAERPGTPLSKTGTKREEVTRANTPQDEDALEDEQKLNGEEGKTGKEGGSEEQTKAPEHEIESDAEDAEPTEATEMVEDMGLLEDSLKDRGVTLFEVTPGFEKSEKVTAPRKEEGGERLSEARETENRAEQPSQENAAPAEQGQEPHHGGKGTLEAAECATRDLDCLAGVQRRGEEGPLQEPGVTMTTQEVEAVPEGEPRMVEKCREAAVDEDPEEDGHEEHTVGTRVTKDSNTEGDGATGGGTEQAEEDLLQGRGAAETASERREVLVDSKIVSGKSAANQVSSSSDAAWEEMWHKGKEVPGKTAGAERVAAEETGQSGEEVTVTSIAEAGEGVLPEPSHLEGKGQQLGQDQEAGEVEVTQGVMSVGEGTGTGSSDSGKAEEFRQASSQERESELSGGSIEAVATLSVKHDFSGTKEEQEHMVQRESESADVSLKDVKD